MKNYKKVLTIAAILIVAAISVMITMKTEVRKDNGIKVMTVNINDADPFKNADVIGGSGSGTAGSGITEAGKEKMSVIGITAIIAVTAVAVTGKKKKTD